MKGVTQAPEPKHHTCPDCGGSTGIVKLGAEPTREICGRFGCSWDGETL